MNSIRSPFNFLKWIDDNKNLLKPPIGNKCLYTESGDFIIMVVGGPNSRKDYHYNETEEFYYQIKGDIVVRTQQNGKVVDIPIKEGEVFLLPPKVPHSPVRSEGSIGMVIECKRTANERDGLMWFCDNCNEPLHDTYFHLTNVEKAFQPRFKAVYGSEDMRTCNACGYIMETDKRFVE